MSSTLSPTRPNVSTGRWATEPSVDTTLRPLDLENDRVPSKRSSFANRVLRLAGFLITFCIGVAASFAWQSYGGAAREMIVGSSPQLGWLALQAAPVEQTAPDTIAPASPAALSPDLEQVKAGLAVVQKSIEQLAAGHEQMTLEK